MVNELPLKGTRELPGEMIKVWLHGRPGNRMVIIFKAKWMK